MNAAPITHSGDMAALLQAVARENAEHLPARVVAEAAERDEYHRALQMQVQRPDLLTLACTGGLQ